MNAAGAADIDALITTAMKAAIEEVVPPFERQTGHTVRVSYGPSGGISRRFLGGEPADLIVIDSGALDEMIGQAKVLPGRTDVARTAIGIAVAKGAVSCSRHRAAMSRRSRELVPLDPLVRWLRPRRLGAPAFLKRDEQRACPRGERKLGQRIVAPHREISGRGEDDPRRTRVHQGERHVAVERSAQLVGEAVVIEHEAEGSALADQLRQPQRQREQQRLGGVIVEGVADLGAGAPEAAHAQISDRIGLEAERGGDGGGRVHSRRGYACFYRRQYSASGAYRNVRRSARVIGTTCIPPDDTWSESATVSSTSRFFALHEARSMARSAATLTVDFVASSTRPH